MLTLECLLEAKEKILRIFITSFCIFRSSIFINFQINFQIFEWFDFFLNFKQAKLK